MKNKKIENKVAQSFSDAKPDVYGNVSAQCPTRASASTAAKRSSVGGWRIATCALAAILVVAIVFGGVALGLRGGSTAVAATVTLDVNPSISVSVDKNNYVVGVEALNMDGEKIIGDMDFKGSHIGVAVYALIGKMVVNGKLSLDANSILVSIEAAQSDYDALLDIVSNEIEYMFGDASIVSQRLDDTARARELSEKYGISVGKAQLIVKILDKVPGKYAEEQLVSLKINELNLILDGLGMAGEEVAQTGSANDGKYIGREAAIAAALATVSVGQTPANVRCKMDFEDGAMIYEVEFVHDNWEYEIGIDALTGDALSYEREPLTKVQGTPVSQEEAKAKALELAQVPQEDRANVTVHAQTKTDDGETEYEINFVYNGYAYEFELDGFGNVRAASKRQPSATGTLGYDDVKQRVVEEVTKNSRFTSLKLSEIRDWEIELDYERGNKVYDIEFKWNNYEFDCELDPNTGAFTFEAEIDD